MADKTEHGVSLFRLIESRLRGHGSFRVHPQRTRIGFISRMTFASVTLRRRWVVLSLVLAEPLGSDRIERIEVYGPSTFVHSVRISSPAEVDHELDVWLGAALDRGGSSPDRTEAEPEAVVGPALTRLVVPLASHVVASAAGPALRLPRWAAAVLGAQPSVAVRLLGREVVGRIASDPDGTTVVVIEIGPGELGLGEGDPVDIALRAP